MSADLVKRLRAATTGHDTLHSNVLNLTVREAADRIEALEAELASRPDRASVVEALEQALSDPENQPSQFGTVPAENYELVQAHVELLRQTLRRTRTALIIAGAKLNSRTITRIDAALANTGGPAKGGV